MSDLKFNYQKNSNKRILIVGLCGIGDLIYFLPTLKNLRRYFYNSEIDLLTFPNGLNTLLEGNSLIDHIEIFPFEKYLFLEKKERNIFKIFIRIIKFIFSVRRKNYDISIWPFSFTSFKKKSLVFLFGAKINIMHNGKQSLFNYILCRNTSWVSFKNNVHNVKLNQDLLAPFNIEVKDNKIEFGLSQQDLSHGKAYLDKLSEGKKKLFVGIHPGGKLLWSQYRQWDTSKFADLADRISKKYNSTALLFGSSGEMGILTAMANLMKSESVIISNLTLREVASIINSLDLFIGNDSALVHVAGCLGTKSISVTGPTNFERTGPWGEQTYVVRLNMPCSPCFDLGFAGHCPHRACLKKLEVNSVYSAVEKIIEANNKEREGLQPVAYNLSVDFQIEKEFPTFLYKRRQWENKYRHNG